MEEQMPCPEDPTMIKGKRTTRTSPSFLITYLYGQEEYKNEKGKNWFRKSRCKT